MKFNYNSEYTPNPIDKIFDMDIASMYGTLVKPLEIKETFMTARTIEIGKTYKLVETEIKTTELSLGYKALTSVLGEGEFVVKSFSKSNWYDKNKAYVIRAHRLDNDEVIKTIVFEAEFILFQEYDPTDLLTRAILGFFNYYNGPEEIGGFPFSLGCDFAFPVGDYLLSVGVYYQYLIQLYYDDYSAETLCLSKNRALISKNAFTTNVGQSGLGVSLAFWW